MGNVDLNYEMSAIQGKYKHLSLSMKEFQRFNTDVLGMGDISKEGEHVDALAAIFDLEGFTSFCNQMDPHLVVPEYLSRMLDWLFRRISHDFTKEQDKDNVILWGKFPFFAKFLGDGVLFLWDTQGLGQASLGNIVVNLFKICRAYQKEFLVEISRDFDQVPRTLRCGVARGEVIALGGGKDFVGPCINMAARLQKVSQLSFAFPRKGFKPEQCFSKTWSKQFVLKRIDIRGIAAGSHVFVCAEEFDGLPDEEKQFFRDA